MCFEIYELDSALFLTAPGLAWQGAFKVIKGKLDLLTDIYVINRKKWYQRRNMSRYSSICRN